MYCGGSGNNQKEVRDVGIQDRNRDVDDKPGIWGQVPGFGVGEKNNNFFKIL